MVGTAAYGESMKQILQNISNGETLLAEVPAPGPRDGSCLIHTSRTLVSLGTEKMLVDFGQLSSSFI